MVSNLVEWRRACLPAVHRLYMPKLQKSPPGRPSRTEDKLKRKKLVTSEKEKLQCSNTNLPNGGETKTTPVDATAKKSAAMRPDVTPEIMRDGSGTG